jgi:hypothetical protein
MHAAFPRCVHRHAHSVSATRKTLTEIGMYWYRVVSSAYFSIFLRSDSLATSPSPCSDCPIRVAAWLRMCRDTSSLTPHIFHGTTWHRRPSIRPLVVCIRQFGRLQSRRNLRHQQSEADQLIESVMTDQTTGRLATTETVCAAGVDHCPANAAMLCTHRRFKMMQIERWHIEGTDRQIAFLKQ